MQEQQNMNSEKEGSYALGFFGTIALYILLAIIYYYSVYYMSSPGYTGWDMGVKIIQIIYGFVFFIASLFVGEATKKKAYRRAIFILLGAFAAPIILMGGCTLAIRMA